MPDIADVEKLTVKLELRKWSSLAVKCDAEIDVDHVIHLGNFRDAWHARRYVEGAQIDSLHGGLSYPNESRWLCFAATDIWNIVHQILHHAVISRFAKLKKQAFSLTRSNDNHV